MGRAIKKQGCAGQGKSRTGLDWFGRGEKGIEAVYYGNNRANGRGHGHSFGAWTRLTPYTDGPPRLQKGTPWVIHGLFIFLLSFVLFYPSTTYYIARVHWHMGWEMVGRKQVRRLGFGVGYHYYSGDGDLPEKKKKSPLFLGLQSMYDFRLLSRLFSLNMRSSRR